MTWVKLERIQFVGACNPPTDPGRVPLSHSFLRHAPLVMVDYPGELTLRQIYLQPRAAQGRPQPSRLRGAPHRRDGHPLPHVSETVHN